MTSENPNNLDGLDELIRSGRYQEARSLLISSSDPQAKEWLKTLDEIEQQGNPPSFPGANRGPAKTIQEAEARRRQGVKSSSKYVTSNPEYMRERKRFFDTHKRELEAFFNEIGRTWGGRKMMRKPLLYYIARFSILWGFIYLALYIGSGLANSIGLWGMLCVPIPMIILGSISASLFQWITERPGKAYSIGEDTASVNDGMVISIYFAEIDRRGYMPHASGAIHVLLDGVNKRICTARRWQSSETHIEFQIDRSFQDVSELKSYIIMEWQAGHFLRPGGNH